MITCGWVLADVVALERPPGVEPLDEELEGLMLGQRHGHRLPDDIEGGLVVHVAPFRSAASLNAASASAQNASR